MYTCTWEISELLRTHALLHSGLEITATALRDTMLSEQESYKPGLVRQNVYTWEGGYIP